MTRAEREVRGTRWMQPLLGVALAAPFVPLFVLHPDGAIDLLTLLLALGAGFRVGAAPAGARAGAMGAAAGLVALALLAFFWSPAWLAAGLGALAAWSLARHLRAPAPRPLLPFGFVWSLAAAAMALWFVAT
jgi:hypothetical protein